MDFDYFYGRGTEQFAFYQVSKMLITDDRFVGITMDSKFLYSFLLDRSSLSAKNGWLDEEGKIYIYYTLEQIVADMHCTNQKATKKAVQGVRDKGWAYRTSKARVGKTYKNLCERFRNRTAWGWG